jgi:hypothetical protein
MVGHETMFGSQNYPITILVGQKLHKVIYEKRKIMPKVGRKKSPTVYVTDTKLISY